MPRGDVDDPELAVPDRGPQPQRPPIDLPLRQQGRRAVPPRAGRARQAGGGQGEEGAVLPDAGAARDERGDDGAVVA